MSMGNLPESLSQAMLVGTMLVGRLGVKATVDPICASRIIEVAVLRGRRRSNPGIFQLSFTFVSSGVYLFAPNLGERTSAHTYIHIYIYIYIHTIYIYIYIYV